MESKFSSGNDVQYLDALRHPCRRRPYGSLIFIFWEWRPNLTAGVSLHCVATNGIRPPDRSFSCRHWFLFFHNRSNQSKRVKDWVWVVGTYCRSKCKKRFCGLLYKRVLELHLHISVRLILDEICSEICRGEAQCRWRITPEI